MTWETRYRPAYQWLWYLCEGWTIDAMPEHQSGRYILVSRRVR